MHIAFLTPEYPNAKLSPAAGIGTSIHNLAKALVRQGVKVTILVYGQKEQKVFTDNEIQIHSIKYKKFQFSTWFFHRKYIENYCNSVIKQQKIDLIEAADWTGITAFMKFKIPLLIRFHGSDTYFCHLEKRKQKWKNFFFEKNAISKADAFIAPTSFAGELSKQLFNLKDKEIQIINYGLDLARFENKAPALFDEGLILYVGTLIRKKGVFELPAIFNKVREQFPEAKLLLIGGDAADVYSQSHSTWELLRQEFKASDIEKVHYLGKIPYDEVQHYIKKANVCVFPTFAETLGMVTIEAMAMQKAVVNSNFGWAQELITDDESGYLVSPKDPITFAHRIVQLLQNKKQCLVIGANARQRVESQFDTKKIVQQNISFYQQLIDKKKASDNPLP